MRSIPYILPMTSKNNLNKTEGNLQRNKCNPLTELDLKVTLVVDYYTKNNGRGMHYAK